MQFVSWFPSHIRGDARESGICSEIPSLAGNIFLLLFDLEFDGSPKYGCGTRPLLTVAVISRRACEDIFGLLGGLKNLVNRRGVIGGRFLGRVVDEVVGGGGASGDDGGTS